MHFSESPYRLSYPRYCFQKPHAIAIIEFDTPYYLPICNPSQIGKEIARLLFLKMMLQCRCTSSLSCSNCWSGINCMLVDFPPKGHTNQNSIQSPSSTYGLLSWIYQAHAAASKINDSVLIFWYAPCKYSPKERHFFIPKHWPAPCISIGIFITDQANPSTQFSSILVITSQNWIARLLL